jgi:hypothetical protein
LLGVFLAIAAIVTASTRRFEGPQARTDHASLSRSTIKARCFSSTRFLGCIRAMASLNGSPDAEPLPGDVRSALRDVPVSQD